ncbi:hypothetical protein [Allobranchiibius sp. GilTou73]|uniref:hypothetical protein n=1 Tax=Allobranchiibius sp. GilTou73 TaxID=2904523 RepID=UPI001F328FF5|nr:hypothetical protein [Allobranchiibius sp. GilTou73]UIJ34315.1 hypothetical protein LVQ62_14525 [Allobranchiibius sp. GilTou73]
MTVRIIEIGRAAWGGALLFAPGATLSHVHATNDEKSVVITRVLGARQLGQAALSGLDPSPEVLAMGVWVDLAHACTAVGLAIADRSRARAGLTDGFIALTWAAIGYRDLQHGGLTTPDHDRRRDHLARTVLHVAPGGRRLLETVRHDRQETP